MEHEIAQPGQFAATTGTATRDATLKVSCGAAAPVVVNGGGFVGCSLASGHAGSHEIKVSWVRGAPTEAQR